MTTMNGSADLLLVVHGRSLVKRHGQDKSLARYRKAEMEQARRVIVRRKWEGKRMIEIYIYSE